MNLLETLIHKEIDLKGPMNFTRFMEFALYHPEHGYYSKAKDSIGRKGDFITSVSVGSLFGKLIAKEFLKWKEGPLEIIECGGWNGQLASDILTNLPKENISYTLVEPLDRLAENQKKQLQSFSNVRWQKKLKECKPINGIIFGNELIDAFPFHRLKFDKTTNKWMECCLTSKNDGLQWILQPCSNSEALPASGCVESNPAALEWLSDAAKVLKSGRILLIDYGYTDEEYFQIERPEGTVRAYRDQKYAENILSNPGEQDITSHVRWTPLMKKAEELGFQVEEFIPQSRWLGRIFAQSPFEISPQEVRQFQTLTHPEMMGSAFRVLILRK